MRRTTLELPERTKLLLEGELKKQYNVSDLKSNYTSKVIRNVTEEGIRLYRKSIVNNNAITIEKKKCSDISGVIFYPYLKDETYNQLKKLKEEKGICYVNFIAWAFEKKLSSRILAKKTRSKG